MLICCYKSTLLHPQWNNTKRQKSLKGTADMNKTTKQNLILYFNATGIPLSYFEGNTMVQNYSHNLQDFDLPLRLFTSLPPKLPDVWYSSTPEHLYFGGILLPPYEMPSRKILLLGPVLVSECIRRQAEDISKRLGLRPKDWIDIQQYFNHIGSCEPQRFKDNLRLLCHLLQLNCPSNVPFVSFHWNIPARITEYPEPIKLPNKTELEMENSILSCIQRGNLHKMNLLLDEQFMASHPTSDLSMADKRICSLGFNLIACDTALRAGADVQLLSNIRGRYINLIKYANTEAELSYIFKQCFREYTTCVAALSTLTSDAPIVKKVHQYILAHYSEKITSTTLAKAFHMSNSYLCHLFKNETGMTIGSYIQQQKIKEAERLLKSSPFTVAEISEILAFSSQSYFCAVFKKETGITPAAYRKSCP